MAVDDDELTPLVSELERLSGKPLPNRDLLREALTHASVESTTHPHNERLEFLGDAVLGLSITTELYSELPGVREGALTELRSHLVSRRTAASVAKRLDLERWINTGKSLDSCAETPLSILGNALEAVVAAVYVQAGFQGALQLVRNLYGPELESARSGSVERNEKMRLQEWTQKASLPLPTYLQCPRDGNSSDAPFEVHVRIGRHEFSPATGPSKREAERLAAREAITEIERDGWDGNRDIETP
ncbi:MAG: ribonuclease III [Planctomycetes bacterium]|nr:ribonuclease III [Planctomycetota bacterium]